MFKSVGIATAGVAIGVPVWGIALAVGGVFLVGVGIGYVIGGATAAVACGAAAVAS